METELETPETPEAPAQPSDAPEENQDKIFGNVDRNFLEFNQSELDLIGID